MDDRGLPRLSRDAGHWQCRGKAAHQPHEEQAAQQAEGRAGAGVDTTDHAVAHPSPHRATGRAADGLRDEHDARDGTDDDQAAQPRFDVGQRICGCRRGDDDQQDAADEAGQCQCLDHEAGAPAEQDRDADDQQRGQVDEVDVLDHAANQLRDLSTTTRMIGRASRAWFA